jgi:GMP synthase (glutamine-hydrolysing)
VRSTPSINYPEVDESVKGIILSGSPYSVSQDDAPHFDFEKYHTKLPILGVCYGAQYLAHFHGGEVIGFQHKRVWPC